MIRGFFVPELVPQPFLRVGVRLAGTRTERKWLPFLVDTGASVTCVHATDAMRLLGFGRDDLDPRTWSDSVQVGSLGAGFRYLERTVEYGFYHDDGRWDVITQVVRIGEVASEGHPSLLGWDLLQHFDMVIRGREKTLTLERA